MTTPLLLAELCKYKLIQGNIGFPSQDCKFPVFFWRCSNKKLNSKSRELLAPAPIFKKNEIKHIRKDLDMTQVEFAQTLNVTVQRVRSWEQGGRKPDSACNRLLQIFEQRPEVIKSLKT